MGFFSSTKQTPVREDPHPVHVVRSRFYNKGKEKARQPLPSGHDRPSFDRHGRLPSTNTNDSFRHSSSVSPRSSVDAITMTLAQRLNELAIANEQGLLDDDEYRLLRQNLFERFTVGSQVPTEAPIVRLAGLGRGSNGHLSLDNNSARPESVRSKVSIASTVSGLFRRATSRRSLSNMSGPSSSDSMSFISVIPSSPKQPSRSVPLGRQTSQSSLRSHSSQILASFSSRETDIDARRSVTPNSKRQGNHAPPSAFSPRSPRLVTKKIPSAASLDGDHTLSVVEIRREIEAVEAEGRRLLDAFNGLELSTLTRNQRRPLGAIPMSTSTILAESDTVSVNSGGSVSMSIKRSRIGRNSSPLVSQPISLSRKNSMSSVSSRAKSVVYSPLGRLGAGSTSSVNLSRHTGYSLLTTVDERTAPLGSLSYSVHDAAAQALEGEMADIRRRRAEVVARYEARLDLLRAKLKGAEMHEKLLKR